MEISFDVTRIRLATFQLECESQLWWDWVKASRDIEAMKWGEFHEVFMGKYFSTTARHANALEFLELKQGTMTVLEYVDKFTELARFADEYVAINMAKVRKFEDGLKLSIRGKIVGFLRQDCGLWSRREKLMMHGASMMWVLVRRRGRIRLLLARGSTRISGTGLRLSGPRPSRVI